MKQWFNPQECFTPNPRGWECIYLCSKRRRQPCTALFWASQCLEYWKQSNWKELVCDSNLEVSQIAFFPSTFQASGSPMESYAGLPTLPGASNIPKWMKGPSPCLLSNKILGISNTLGEPALTPLPGWLTLGINKIVLRIIGLFTTDRISSQFTTDCTKTTQFYCRFDSSSLGKTPGGFQGQTKEFCSQGKSKHPKATDVFCLMQNLKWIQTFLQGISKLSQVLIKPKTS